MHALTPYEQSLVQDAGVLLAKNAIIEKMLQKFGMLSQLYADVINRNSTEGVHTPPKISKGEKYHGLPYLVLDYPRQFTSDNIYAIRTLFWWGNYFSITLQLEGSFLDEFKPQLQHAHEQDAFSGWYMQTGGDKWQHAINEDYEQLVPGMHPSLATVSFLKLAKKIPLQEWDNIEELLLKEYSKLVHVLYAPIR